MLTLYQELGLMSDYFFTNSIRPNCHRRIGQCDSNIRRGEAMLTLPRITKEETKLVKIVLKIFTAEKAFMICACNRDKIGCQKWFDKTNERSLLAMEKLEEIANDEKNKMGEGIYLHFSDKCVKTFHKNASWVLEHL